MSNINNQLIKEKLIKIKTLINDPKHWTQGVYALDAAGSSISPRWKEAVCFCLVGAIEKAVYSDSESITNELYREIKHYIEKAISIITNTPADQCFVIDYNDTHTHAEVITLLDKAIALCE